MYFCTYAIESMEKLGSTSARRAFIVLICAFFLATILRSSWNWVVADTFASNSLRVSASSARASASWA